MSSLNGSGESLRGSGSFESREFPTKQETKSHKIWDGIKRYTLIPTNILLPFSSRSIPANLLSLPIRLSQSLYLGLKEAIQNRSIKTLFTGTAAHAKEKIQAGWKGGISDSYTNLASAKNREEGIEVAQKNLKYAGYIRDYNFDGTDSVKWSGELISSAALDDEESKKTFGPLIAEVHALGFKEDGRGHFYDTKTGTIFTIVYDQTDEGEPEIIFCFEGHNTEENLTDVKDEEVEAIKEHAYAEAIKEYLGGIPKSARQAISLGDRLKNFAEDKGFTERS